MSAVFAYIAFLKSNAGVSSIVGTRVFPRRLENEPTLPALVVHKISEFVEDAHNGMNSIRKTRVQVDAWAKTVYEVEQLEAAILAASESFTGTQGSIEVQTCFHLDTGDLPEEDGADLKEFGGSLDFEITWY